MRFRLLAIPFLFFTALHAQEQILTLDTQASTEQLHQWLHSGDPRQIAWAATLARTSHNQSVLAEMPALLLDWKAAPLENQKTKWDETRAIDAVLDALIQEKIDTPIPAVRVIEKAFDVQSTILMSREAPSLARETLTSWVIGPNVGYSRQQQRVAAMLLAKDPPGSHVFFRFRGLSEDAGFAASIVATSQERLTITLVSNDEPRYGVVAGSTCGDGGGTTNEPGWPVTYTYDLVEPPQSEHGITVVDLAGDRIVARRYPAYSGNGSCYGVQELNATTRHRLIAYWLGITAHEMPWQPTKNISIVWRGQADFDHRLSAAVLEQQRLTRETSNRLVTLGFMTQAEAKRYSPEILIHIECAIDPCPLENTDLVH